MLEIINFSKAYKEGKKAVDHLNIAVKAGISLDLLDITVRGKVQQLSR